MSAICKTIAIHGDYLGNLMRYGDNPEKTSLLNNGLENLLSYAENTDKTTIYLKEGEKSVLVDGVLCDPKTAELDFKIFRDRYRAANGNEFQPEFDMENKRTGKTKHVKKAPVTAIHLIQSFSDTEIDPQLVHQIGIEMLEQLGVQGVCDTHVNKDHCHNHIIINAYLPDGRTKFCLDKQKILDLRTLSNSVLQEYGLSIDFDEPRRQLYKSKQREKNTPVRGTGSAQQKQQSVPQQNAVPVSPTENLEPVPPTQTAGFFPLDLIDTSRFAWDGRRRSGLEMLIRYAIATLQKVIIFMKEDPGAEKDRPQQIQRLSFLENALTTMDREDIHSFNELKAALNDAGIKLNKAKTEINTLKSEEGLKNQLVLDIGRYEAAKYAYDSVQYWSHPHNLHLNEYPKEVIAHNRASLAPVTYRQQQELIKQLRKHDSYRIDGIAKGFANLSAVEAQQVIDFLSEKTDEKPAVLISKKEFWDKYGDRLIERQTSLIREKGVPEIDPRPARDKFDRDIADEPAGKRDILLSLRDACEGLASLGYRPEDIPSLKEKIAVFETRQTEAESERQQYSSRYRDLLRLKQAVRYAERDTGTKAVDWKEMDWNVLSRDMGQRVAETRMWDERTERQGAGQREAGTDRRNEIPREMKH